ncbi:CpXC domain-containing protein [Arenibaculum pallidiluteum]|uniref:CpXC domain-containing protein n=1 Tax=Arenibaculum pallidiluteum TaxID=2812559 RepID=UPI001A97AD2F|nr:CpXC domain-containing protein [Arenibaculum pallidiluteum]
MSLIVPVEGACPACGHALAFETFASINADRRPDLRDAILDGSLQASGCPGCDQQGRAPCDLVYLDVERRSWILAHPASDLLEWSDREEDALDMFQEAFGPLTPLPVRAMGREFRVRLVFGWPAFAEKLRCQDLGLDDELVELAKVAVMRESGTVHLDQTELRLVGGDQDEITFAWIDPGTEQAKAFLTAPRTLLTGIEANPAAWAALRAEISQGPFVDINRVLVPASGERNE